MDRPVVIRSALALLLPTAAVLYPVPSAVVYGALALTQPARRSLPGTYGAVALAVALLLSGIASARGLQVVGIGAAFLAVLSCLWLLSTRMDKVDVAPLRHGLLLMLVVNLVAATYQVHVLGESRAAGLLLHANLLGSMVAPLALTFLPAGPLRRGGGARLFGIVVALILLVYSASRGAVLGLLLGALAAAFVYAFRPAPGLRNFPRRAGIVLAATLIAVVAGVVALYAPFSPLAGRLESLESVGDPMGRTLLWSAALELVAHRPFLGYGPMAWTDHVSVVEPIIRPEITPHAHSLFLEVALWAGLMGLGGLAWMVGGILAALLSSRLLSGWSSTGIGAVTAMITVSVFDAAGAFLPVLMVWVLVLGMVLAMSEAESRPMQGEGDPEHERIS